MSAPWTRLAPGGSAIPIEAILSAARRNGDAALDAVRSDLAARFEDHTATLHASGRDALRAGLSALAEASGRDEVVLPAYACYSIPAAVVRAGLRVRLVDTDARGWIDPAALAETPLERAAAVVVTNLFGVPEPVEAIADVVAAAGAFVVDDAAQALGARGRDGLVGARGDLGLLSFGRGKPLSALGGGVLLRRTARHDALGTIDARPPRAGSGIGAAFRALAYDVARSPWVLGPLAHIPALGIGTTVYDTQFATGELSGEALALAAALLPTLDLANADRAARATALAQAIAADTRFEPLVARPDEVAIHPRLGVLAPSHEARDRALARLAHLGATAMYPATLDRVEALAPDLVSGPSYPGARDFCARLLTLPTHAGLTPRRRASVVSTLADLA